MTEIIENTTRTLSSDEDVKRLLARVRVIAAKRRRDEVMDNLEVLLMAVVSLAIGVSIGLTAVVITEVVMYVFRVHFSIV